MGARQKARGRRQKKKTQTKRKMMTKRKISAEEKEEGFYARIRCRAAVCTATRNHLDNWEDRIIETDKGIVRLLPVGRARGTAFRTRWR